MILMWKRCVEIRGSISYVSPVMTTSKSICHPVLLEANLLVKSGDICKLEHQFKTVACLEPVKFYLQYAYGVDLLNSILGYYSIRIWWKKSYHRVFHPQLSIVNACLLWKGKTNSDIPLIEFKLGITDRLCMVEKSPKTKSKGRPST